MSNPIGMALICDDIRHELNEQHTLVGVITDRISVKSIPTTIVKLGIYIRIHFEFDFDPCDVSVVAIDSDGPEINLVTFYSDEISQIIQKARDEGDIMAGVYTSLIASPFSVTDFGRLIIEMRWRDQRLRIGGVKFVQDLAG